MNTNIAFRRRKRRRGSILATAFVLCMIAAVAAIWLMTTLVDTQKMNARGRHLERAYFAAEAGVAQVLQWGNFPADYDGGGTGGLFYRAADGSFPNLIAALPVYISSAKLGSFTSSHGDSISNVNSVTLLAPAPATDPVTCLFKIRSVGKTPVGRARTVLAYVAANPLGTTSVALQAGLISMATAAQAGNGTVHWGEAWSKSDFAMLNKSQCDHLNQNGGSYDQWAKYRTEGHMSFPSNWKSGTGKDIYQEGSPQYRRFPGSAPASGDFALGLEQSIPSGTLSFPDFLSKYQDFKTLAQAHGRYYGTDSSGNIYRDGIKDTAHKVSSFDTEFGEADRVTSPYDLVFIDTTDGTAPRYGTGTNVATVTNSGTGIGMKGIFYVCANFAQTGAGNPASLTVEKPDNTYTTLSKVYLDGVFYSAGTIDYGGNPVIFGSVITQKGYIGGGTPDIYYNYKLKTGLDIPTGNAGSVFKILQQKNSG